MLERKLPNSPVKQETPVERLLSDIRGGKARQSLRRARTRSRVNTSELVESLERVAIGKKRGRKTIEPELDFQSSLYNFEDSQNTSFDEESFKDCGEHEKGQEQDNEDRREEGEEDVPRVKKGVTLEELSIIRLKLTRAHLEMAEDDLRLALDKGKLCFSCKKTRFNFYTWSHQCHICHRAICKGRSAATQGSSLDSEFI